MMVVTRILPYILVFILLVLNLNILFPEIFTGDLIMRIKKPKIKGKLTSTLMLGFAIVVFSVLIVINIINYKQSKPYTGKEYYIYQIVFNVFWILYLLFQYIRSFKPIEIREKGVFFENGIFIKFKKIYSYTWKSPNVLEIDSKRVFKLGGDYQLIFNDNEEALKFDEILQNYAKKV